MSTCPNGSTCVFFTAVEPSVIKRIRFASAFPYCKGHRHDDCAIFVLMERGERIPDGLMPDGTTAHYLDDAHAPAAGSPARRFLVVDESPVFASIAANAVSQRYPDAEVVQCHSYDEAEPLLRAGAFSLIVSGSSLGGGRDVSDLRRSSSAPIVLSAGSTREVGDLPRDTRVVEAAAGPGALRAAIEGMLG